MVKPRKEGATRRRVLSISLYATLAVVLVASAPLWLAAAFLVGLARRRSFIVLRLLLFGTFYFSFEIFTLLRIAMVCIRFRRSPDRLQTRIVALQGWWAGTIMGVARGLLQLDFSIEGLEQATPGPAILLIRHASILDTLLPSVFIQRPTGWRVRYVVKQELLADPCLDVAGHILPNYFVDRTGDTQRELAGIRALAADLGTDGVLIFPEGTRFSEQKQARVLQRIARETPALLPRAEALEGVLPPKLGGVTTLLDELPEVDCVFLAHRGLERFAKIHDLLSGEVVGETVHVRIWRVRADEIPRDDDARVRWLFDQWDHVSAFVTNRAR
ncbi:MAG: lysophospholipid acyltransferase family protein [Myxococcota bacterium]